MQIGDGMSTSMDRVGETQGTRPGPLGRMRLEIIDIGDRNDQRRWSVDAKGRTSGRNDCYKRLKADPIGFVGPI